MNTKKYIHVNLPRRSGRIVKLNDKVCTTFIASRSSRNKTHINQLPSEILLKIFSYIDISELFKNVRCVCRRWKLLALVPTLWKSIDVDNSIPSSILELWIRNSSLLNSFSAQNRNDLNFIFELVNSKIKISIEFLLLTKLLCFRFHVIVKC